MISEFFLNVIFQIVTWLFSFLPNVGWNTRSVTFQGIMDIIRVAGYMLPLNTIGTIAGVIVSITVFKIVITIIRTIWDILPIV